MRVLLIDNHDSFTHNLAHDIAAVTGRLPDVVAHDAPLDCDVQAWLRGYDAVVVSPGPGTPERAADLGHSLAAVQQDEVPVLGVCLGMQAMAHVTGGRIVRAPRPVHGEVADIRHDGAGLFAGLPDPLPMVRYHSLVVTDLPDDLVVDATCDGLVMGLHSRTRPWWGVQTHPESISSAHGRDLVATFLRLAREWNVAHPRPSTQRQHPEVGEGEASPGAVAGSNGAGVRDREAAGPGGDGAPSTGAGWTVLARAVDVPAPGVAERVFDGCFRGRDHAWWLDSAAGAGFSACGCADGPLARVVRMEPDALHVRDAAWSRSMSEDLFDLLAGAVTSPEQVDVVVSSGEPGSAALSQAAVTDLPFALGWVGYLSYEHGAGLLLGEDPDELPADETPLATLVFADRAVVVDGDRAWVLALTDGRADVTAAQRAWTDRIAARVSALAGDPAPAGLPDPPAVESVSIRHGREAYLGLVEQCQEYIAAGESYELCLTNRIEVRTRADAWDLYRRLRATSPRPFAAYLEFDGGHVLSASPERFVSVSTDGLVEAKPIKGTRRRGDTPEEDARLAAELRADVKERAENLMIVDLLRHDLSSVCEPGSVHVPLLFDVETHAGVHQLVSTIRGRLRAGATALDAVRAALPGGSMTGAPKERSVRLLRDLDGGPRGVYSGVVGYVSLTGAADWSIVIRTIVHHPDHLTYGVGGAITARSDARAEWEETLVKARTLGAALGVDLDEVLDR